MAVGSVAIVLGLVAAAMPVRAAEYVRPRSPVAGSGAPIRIARQYLAREAGGLGIRGVELVEPHVLRAGLHTTVRLTQSYRGIPVLGKTVAVHLDADGRVRLAMIDVAKGLAVDVTPAVSVEGAIDAVRARVGADVRAREPQLAIEPGTGRGGTLVWVVDVPSGQRSRRYVVDAQRGDVLSDRLVAMEALGRVYPISAVVTPQVEDRELLALTPATPTKLTGWDGQLVVTNFIAYGVVQGEVFLAQLVEPSDGENFLYDPPADPLDTHDAFAQVNAYYQLSRARTYFGSTFGLDMSGPQWKLVAATNVENQGKPFDGAYYSPAGVGAPWNSPNLLGVGQGSKIDFAYDSDVFLHEFTHYVNYNAVRFDAGQYDYDDWGWAPFSIAIDEGVADYFACTMNGGPIVGEATLAPLGKARDLSDTSKRCPDDVVGEGHLDGEIVGSFTWSLREALGSEAADQLVWGAVSLLPYGASFGDFVVGVRQIADDLVQEGRLTDAGRKQIEQILHERGLDNCGRAVEIPVGESRTMLMVGLDTVAQANNTTCAQLKTIDSSVPGIFHFSATPPSSARGLRFSIEMSPWTAGALEWSAYIRAGQHVTFGVVHQLPAVVGYDRAITGVTSSTAQLVVDDTTEPPFDPTSTYDLALAHRNCPGVTVKVSVEAIEGQSEPDAGTEADGDTGVAEAGVVAATGSTQGAGCGCRIEGETRGSGGRGAAGWEAALLVSLAGWGLWVRSAGARVTGQNWK